MEPIRVLCLFTIMNRGGAETMCMNLYRHMDREKVQFDFLVYHPEEGSYEEEIQRLGGYIFRIPHAKNLVAHIKGARDFFAAHPEYRIVHNHMQSNGAYICREAKKAGVPVVIYHSHSGPVPIIDHSISLTTRRLISKYVNEQAWKYYTNFFACGDVAALAVPAKFKTEVIYNAIDIDLFKYNKKTREIVRRQMNCRDRIIIGNVARIDHNKNQRFAIDIMKELIKVVPNSELWLVGDGELKNETQLYIERNGISKNIKMLGVHNDVSCLLQAMDVYLFPSIREGLPVSCIEAQAAGLPCVFSDGIDSTVDITGNCEVLSLKESPCVWAGTIINQIQNYERKDVSQKIKDAGYDIEHTAKKMQDFYLSAIHS